jgi:hypothetical protein
MPSGYVDVKAVEIIVAAITLFRQACGGDGFSALDSADGLALPVPIPRVIRDAQYFP